MEGSGFSGLSQKTKRWDDVISWLAWPEDNEWHQYRFFGNIVMVATHWVTTKKGKRFPLVCPNFDISTGSFSKSGCPACEDFDHKNSPDENVKNLQARQNALAHVIVRELQKVTTQDPGFRPWKPVRVPMSLALVLQQLKSMNVHEINGTSYQCDVADPYYGMDVYVLHNPRAASPSQRYAAQRATTVALTQAEMGYLNEQYDWQHLVISSSISEIKTALVQNGYYKGPSGPGGGGHSDPYIGDSILPGVPRPTGLEMPQAPQHMPPPAQFGVPAPGQAMPKAPAYAPVPPQAPQAPQYMPPPPPAFAAPQAPQPQAPQAPQYMPPPPPVQNSVAAPAQNAPWEAPPYQQPQTIGQTALQQQPVAVVQQAPHLQVVPAPAPVDTGAKIFAYPGKPNGVSGDEFQGIIKEFSATVPRGSQLKSWDKDDLAGMQVLQCFSSYAGDAFCFKCPVRRQCLRY